MVAIARKLLIAGLGNPGRTYEKTRHNAGRRAVDFLADTNAWKVEKNYLVAKSDDAVFIKPETFMNLSGLAVVAAMAKYKIPLENVIVIHDDIDLKLGDLRSKVGGGNAGHNGLKSIDGAIGRDYTRVRIGVGRPDNIDFEISDWVLARFSDEELKTISDLFPKIRKIIYPECL